MSSVAEGLIRGGQSAAQIQRQYAQSMIDQRNLVAAQSVLKGIIADADSPGDEKAEARGLLGRIYKQLYIDANDSTNSRQQGNLRNAIKAYYDVFKTEPKAFLWHGINAVALLARAQRDGVTVEGYPAYREIAQQIRAILDRIQPLKVWDCATAVETAVALDDADEAVERAVKYSRHREADAFEIGSLLRQLTEVWQLSIDDDPGSTILPLLKSALLKRSGGALTVDPKSLRQESNNAEASNKKLARVFGTDRFQPLAWLKTGLRRCEAVAAVETVMGKRIGTGFLVKAGDFFPAREKDELLFLTNAHVISPLEHPFPGAIPPDAGQVNFEALGRKYPVSELIWSSSPLELDATFIKLEGIESTAELCPLTPAPQPFDPEKKPRVYVIGYPLGGPLAISLQDSHWLGSTDPYLHYRTPTEPGSSGSPVFDQEFWTVIGLHHAGEKDPNLHPAANDEANEAIAITAIQQRTRAAGAGSGTT